MKKLLLFSLLLVFALVPSEAFAQSKKKKKKPKKEDREVIVMNDDDDDSPGKKFKDRLWYGAGLGLNFGGGQGYTAFNLSVSPMVGYKITDEFSVGPRVGVNYVYIKQSSAPFTTGSFADYTLGAFTRYRFFNMFFAHLEYENLNRAIPRFENDNIVSDREFQNNAYIGLGYSPAGGSGGVGYEATLLFNLLEPKDSPGFPISYRIGFNYNF